MIQFINEPKVALISVLCSKKQKQKLNNNNNNNREYQLSHPLIPKLIKNL